MLAHKHDHTHTLLHRLQVMTFFIFVGYTTSFFVSRLFGLDRHHTLRSTNHRLTQQVRTMLAHRGKAGVSHVLEPSRHTHLPSLTCTPPLFVFVFEASSVRTSVSHTGRSAQFQPAAEPVTESSSLREGFVAETRRLLAACGESNCPAWSRRRRVSLHTHTRAESRASESVCVRRFSVISCSNKQAHVRGGAATDTYTLFVSLQREAKHRSGSETGLHNSCSG